MQKITRIEKEAGEIKKTQIDAPTVEYVPVRIRGDLYQKAAAKAREEGRSLIKQINYLLEQSLKES